MRRALCGVVVLLLAMPMLRADDKPKDDQKSASPKEQFESLEKEFSSQRSQMLSEIQKLKGADQQKQIQKYLGLGGEFAEKFYKIAEDHPDDPAATSALFWIAQNSAGSPTFSKAIKKLTPIIEKMPLDDLAKRLRTVRTDDVKIMEIVFNRAQQEIKSDDSGELLAWVVQTSRFRPVGQKALGLLAENHPDHPAAERAVMGLANSGNAKAVGPLQTIVEKATKPRVKALATLALGQSLAAKVDTLGDNISEANKTAEEAERYLTKFVDEYSKDFPPYKAAANSQIKALHFNRVGLTAPEITSEDLDAKEFKLSDYRGKVVLLDFWGNW